MHTMIRRVLRVTVVSAAMVTALQVGSNASDEIRWKPIGPGGGGNMVAVGVSPVDPDIVIMGGDVGGLQRSVDGGLTWTLVNSALIDPARFSGYGSFPGSRIEFDPVDPRLVYRGIEKSRDAGVTWRINVDESKITAAGSLVDPLHHDIVYAYGYGNVYRSSDGWESRSCVTASGASCSQQAPRTTCAPRSRCYQASCLPGGPSGGCPNYVALIRDLVLDPKTPGRLLACARSGLYESLDGATTWSRMTPAGLPHDGCQALGQQYDPVSRLLTLYLLLPTEPHQGIVSKDAWIDIDTWSGGVYRSTDGGAHWDEANGIDGPNLFSNGGFETPGRDAVHPAAGWMTRDPSSVSRDCGMGHVPGSETGCSIRIRYSDPKAGPAVEVDPPLPLQGGELFTLSAWFKADQATGYPVYSKVHFYDERNRPLNFPGVAWNSVEPFTVEVGAVETSFDWRRYEALFRAPDAARSMRITYSAEYGGGTSWIDDVSLKRSHSLPRIAGFGGRPYFAAYTDLVVDPTDANTVYAGTRSGTWGDSSYADQGGVFKTTNGGTTWTLATRRHWHANVLDSVVPQCGDTICGGKWENCRTCPVDCAGAGRPAPPACCGDASCDAGLDASRPLESADNCPGDCPFDPDPGLPGGMTIAPAQAGTVGNGSASLGVWTLGIGSGPLGHQTLYMGGEHMKTSDAGATWTELSTMLYQGADSQEGTAAARGATNDVYAYSVVTDTRIDPETGHPMNRLYYGDTDNFLQVSYNGGRSFAHEGWQWLPDNRSPHAPSAGITGDAASSIVLDPADPNTLYVGVNEQAGDTQGFFDPDNTCCGGVVKGRLGPANGEAVRRWTWTPVGTRFPKGRGGTELLRTSSGEFFASVFNRGVYRLDRDETWVKLETGWNPVPAGWLTHRMLEEPSSHRLYVAAGHTTNLPTPPGGTGVWESSDDGRHWTLITDPGSDTGRGMSQEPVLDMALDGPDTLFVATWYGRLNRCSPNCTEWDGDGGLYKGRRDPATGSWSWMKVLAQPMVTGVVVSPASRSILYAFVGQIWPGYPALPHQAAGIYKSIDGGDNWSPLPNDGLMRVDNGKLFFSSGDPHTIYASTIGDGVFEGAIRCGPPSEGFADADGDGVPDCAFIDVSRAIPTDAGQVVSGDDGRLGCAAADNRYEVLQEDTEGAARQMVAIWQFDDVPVDREYELWVQGFRTAGGGAPADGFEFSLLTKPVGSVCSAGDFHGNARTLLTVSRPRDDGKAQTAAIGHLEEPVVCLKAEDSRADRDTQTETLTLNRVCLRRLPGAANRR